jgi:hypothetical protein
MYSTPLLLPLATLQSLHSHSALIQRLLTDHLASQVLVTRAQGEWVPCRLFRCRPRGRAVLRKLKHVPLLPPSSGQSNRRSAQQRTDGESEGVCAIGSGYAVIGAMVDTMGKYKVSTRRGSGSLYLLLTAYSLFTASSLPDLLSCSVPNRCLPTGVRIHYI